MNDELRNFFQSWEDMIDYNLASEETLMQDLLLVFANEVVERILDSPRLRQDGEFMQEIQSRISQAGMRGSQATVYIRQHILARVDSRTRTDSSPSVTVNRSSNRVEIVTTGGGGGGAGYATGGRYEPSGYAEQVENAFDMDTLSKARLGLKKEKNFNSKPSPIKKDAISVPIRDLRMRLNLSMPLAQRFEMFKRWYEDNPQYLWCDHPENHEIGKVLGYAGMALDMAQDIREQVIREFCDSSRAVLSHDLAKDNLARMQYSDSRVPVIAEGDVISFYVRMDAQAIPATIDPATGLLPTGFQFMHHTGMMLQIKSCFCEPDVATRGVNYTYDLAPTKVHYSFKDKQRQQTEYQVRKQQMESAIKNNAARHADMVKAFCCSDNEVELVQDYVDALVMQITCTHAPGLVYSSGDIRDMLKADVRAMLVKDAREYWRDIVENPDNAGFIARAKTNDPAIRTYPLVFRVEYRNDEAGNARMVVNAICPADKTLLSNSLYAKVASIKAVHDYKFSNLVFMKAISAEELESYIVLSSAKRRIDLD